MTRPPRDDEYAEDERYLREVARERAERQREHAPMIVEPKDGQHIPPDVAERQTRFYRELLNIETEETDGNDG